MNFKKQIKYVLLFIAILQTIACSTTYHSVISNRNISSLYDEISMNFIPESYIYHKTDSSSVLYLKLNLDEFLFKLDEETEEYKADISIHYNIFSSYDSSEILDSTTANFIISKSGNPIFNTELNIKIKSNSILELAINDKNRNKTEYDYLEIRKDKGINLQDFKLINVQSNEILYSPYINSNTPILLKSERIKPTKLYISYFKPVAQMPKPPFALQAGKENMQVDSNWIVNYNDSVKFDFSKTGTYYLSKDSFLTNGFCIYRFYDDFPTIFRPEQMLLPIKYLTTNKEFKDLSMFADKKNAVDNFWLGLGGNVSRTKELIKNYYSRVQLANKNFSTYKQGWLTDRGMIYTILGKPNSVYKTENYEKWIYGNDIGYSTLTYMFTKKENLLSDNDFELIRSELYKSVWYNAVETWRKGLEYSIGK